MNLNDRTRNIVFFVTALLIIIIFYQFMLPGQAKPKDVSLSTFKEQVNDKKVESVEVKGNELIGKTDNGEIRTYKEDSVSLTDYGITPDKAKITIDNPDSGALWSLLLSTLLPFLLIAAFIYFMLKSAQGSNMKAMSFGQSKARLFTGKKKTGFKDVAGNTEAKQELFEIVEFLKYPGKFKKLGAEIPKGVLLIGPPGTGKTLMARAVAGEAGAPFFSISASEFVEMFVGVGASRVRDLFDKAKRSAPAILFIDELDAIGRHRGTGMGGGHDEREQTLNQILVEMDGFETDTQVIVMAATNRPDVLDPALLRPGRFDRRVTLDLPDIADRLEILKIHAANKPLDKNLNLKQVAQTSAGFSGADLKNLVNEAAIFAARNNRKEITQLDMNEAVEKVLLGPERRGKVMSDMQKKTTAYHEAGHALIAAALKHTDTVHKVSIISRGMALGYTWTRPEEDQKLYTKEKFEDEIAQLLGGRLAEKIIFNQLSTGASNDLQKAYKIARDMVTKYGMSDKIGPVSFEDQNGEVFLGKSFGHEKTYSPKVAFEIDTEITNIILNQEKRAETILKKKKATLDKIANRLLKDETIDQKVFESLLV